MKIGHLEAKPPVAAPSPERQTPLAREVAAGSESSAKVALSAAAAELAASGAQTSFDHAKVELIAQAIREGRFEINADAIADKLIANAQELLSRGAR